MWRSRSYWDVGLLIFSLVLSLFFASLVASYLQQLLNPALLRQRTAQVAPSSQYNYPLQVYPPNPYGQPQQQPYDQGFVPPPYNPAGGPPGYGGNEAPFDPPKEKDPFADGGQMTSEQREQQQHEEMRRRAAESTDSVDLTPRRENEGRV